jgi:cytochrome c-type biogenesis protein
MRFVLSEDFSLIFILLGALAGTFGALVSQWLDYIRIVFGILLILLGLNFAGIIVIPFFVAPIGREIQYQTLRMRRIVCDGHPVLHGLDSLCRRVSECRFGFRRKFQTVFHGILLLAVYSLGLGLPLFLSAILMDYLSSVIRWIKKNYRVINLLSGLLLIVLGVLEIYRSLSAVL